MKFKFFLGHPAKHPVIYVLPLILFHRLKQNIGRSTVSIAKWLLVAITVLLPKLQIAHKIEILLTYVMKCSFKH